MHRQFPVFFVVCIFFPNVFVPLPGPPSLSLSLCVIFFYYSNVWTGGSWGNSWAFTDWNTWYDPVNGPEPNNFGGIEDCVEMNANTDPIIWNDVDCNEYYEYQCGYDMGFFFFF